jgi:hypothetical protein
LCLLEHTAFLPDSFLDFSEYRLLEHNLSIANVELAIGLGSLDLASVTDQLLKDILVLIRESLEESKEVVEASLRGSVCGSILRLLLLQYFDLILILSVEDSLDEFL